MLPELMRIATASGPERFLAVQALAFVDDPEAQAKVLETAKSEEVPRAERLSAVALLSQLSLTEAVNYLQDLAVGDDKELARCATEALVALQIRRKAGDRR
jgi:hypothetical protein